MMGNCILIQDQHKALSNIEKSLKKNAMEERPKKILLLGTCSSGKSTIFKQLKCIHGLGFEHQDFYESRHCTRSIMVLGMLKLLAQSDRFRNDYGEELATFGYIRSEWNKCDMNNYLFPPTYLINLIQQYFHISVDLNDDKIMDAIKCIASFREESFERYEVEMIVDWDEMEELGRSIELIWNLQAIRHTYAEKGSYFSFPDNMDYFFNKVSYNNHYSMIFKICNI